jgi:hypothetical protein
VVNFVIIGQHAVHLQRVDRVMFPDENTALVFFSSLEARTCSECGDFFETLAALITAAESFFVTVADHPEAGLRRIRRAFLCLVDHYLASIL